MSKLTLPSSLSGLTVNWGYVIKIDLYNPSKIEGTKGFETLFTDRNHLQLTLADWKHHFLEQKVFTFSAENGIPYLVTAFPRGASDLFLELLPLHGTDAEKLRDQVLIKEKLRKLLFFEDLSRLLSGFINDLVEYMHASKGIVLQFDDEGHAIARTESEKTPSFRSFYGLKFRKEDAPHYFKKRLEQGQCWYFPELAVEQYFPVLPDHPPGFRGDWPTRFSVPVGNFLLSYFTLFEMRSAAIFPIMNEQGLWGMILIGYQQKTELPVFKLSGAELLTSMLPTQLKLKEEQRAKGQTRIKVQLLNFLLEQLTSTEGIPDVLEKCKKEVLDLVGAKGAALFLEEKWLLLGQCPPSEFLKSLRKRIEEVQHSELLVTDHLEQQFPEFMGYRKYASGMISASLGWGTGQYLFWFRPEFPQVVRWAGNPSLSANEVPLSFAPWNQLKRGYSLPWAEEDLYYLGEFRKILVDTHFRKVEEEFRQTSRFRLMLQNSSDIIAILEPDFSIRFLSPSIESILGASVQEIIHLGTEVLHPEDVPRLKDYLESCLSTKGPLAPFEYRVKHKNGHYLYFETIANNLIEDSAVNGILINSREITSRYLVRKRLKKFEKIIEATNNGVLIVKKTPSQGYKVSYANPAYYKLSKQNNFEVIGHSCLLLEEEEFNLEQIEQLKNALADEKDIQLTMQVNDREGNLRSWNVQVAPARDDQNNVDFLIVISDLTQEIEVRKQLEDFTQKLHYSNQELETFAYVASHDLQEPLRTISGFTELLAESFSGKLNEENDEYISFILQATDRMRNLIRDLLEFSRLNTHQGYIKEVNLNQVVRQTLENLRNVIEEKGVEITVPPLPLIFFNETLISQVFQNLISNAIKYANTDFPSEINIDYKEQETEWQFSIKDNGIGIDKEYHERIFVIFQRLHTSDEYSGTGIGLAICKKIIEKFGGKIWVQSTPGKGATFYFTIPKVLEFG